GRPVLTDIKLLAGTAEPMLIRLAGSIERGSEHPLAQAIVADARAKHISLVEPEDFDSVPGKGAKGIVDGHDVAVGNTRLMQDLDIAVAEQDDAVAALR